MQLLLQVLEDPGTWLLNFSQVQLLPCSEMEEEHDLRGHNVDCKVWVYMWILEPVAVSGWLSPRAAPPLQEPAESGQGALTMPCTDSQGAAGDRTWILSPQRRCPSSVVWVSQHELLAQTEIGRAANMCKLVPNRPALLWDWEPPTRDWAEVSPKTPTAKCFQCGHREATAMPELASAPSLCAGSPDWNSRAVPLKGLLSAELSGEELLFSPPLTIQLHCCAVLVDLCLLNLGISASNLNDLFKHCCFNAVTDPLWK